MKRLLYSFAFACSLTVLSAQGAGLKIVVIAGEDAVNVVQQKTAVAPVVEVRDRNNQPVAGAVVRFAIQGSRATFGGAKTLTVTTNVAGRAAASGLTPTGSGVFQIGASATFQGQTAAAVTIAQTNVLTAAEAAAASSAGAGGAGGTGGGTAAGGAAGSVGGGLSMTTLAIVGGAVAGGAVVATKVVSGGEDAFVHISGTVFATITFEGPATCNGTTGNSSGTGNSCFHNVVSGATVSTTIDSTTTTTDGSGHFNLVTKALEKDWKGCKSFALTISAANLPTYSQTWFGTGNPPLYSQQFALSPPTPSILNCNQ